MTLRRSKSAIREARPAVAVGAATAGGAVGALEQPRCGRLRRQGEAMRPIRGHHYQKRGNCAPKRQPMSSKQLQRDPCYLPIQGACTVCLPGSMQRADGRRFQHAVNI